MNKEEIVDFSTLEFNIQLLIKQGVAVREYSYSPYSKFKVGAAILCDDGAILTGCNIENVSYPVSLCAERVAISKAISEGKKGFKALAVVANNNDGSFVTPCGMCRQFIKEFGDMQIYLCNTNIKNVLKTTATSLLPQAFNV